MPRRDSGASIIPLPVVDHRRANMARTRQYRTARGCVRHTGLRGRFGHIRAYGCQQVLPTSANCPNRYPALSNNSSAHSLAARSFALPAAVAVSPCEFMVCSCADSVDAVAPLFRAVVVRFAVPDVPCVPAFALADVFSAFLITPCLRSLLHRLPAGWSRIAPRLSRLQWLPGRRVRHHARTR